MPDVEVIVEETPAEPASETVIVTPDTSADVTATLLDHEQRLTRLEMAQTVTAEVIDTVTDTIADAQITADIALDVAHDATEIAIDAAVTAEETADIAVATADETGVLPEVFEDVQQEIPEDVTPRRTNIMFAEKDELKTRMLKR